MTDRDRVLLAAVGLFVAVVTAIAAVGYLGVIAPPTAIRTGFAVVAAAIGLVVYLGTRGVDSEAPIGTPAVSAPQTAKLVVAGGALAVAATAWTGERLLPLLAFLPLGYLLVAEQVRRDGDTAPTLLSAVTLFVVPVYTKYLTTGFYFGGTDTFAHVDGLNRLLSVGYSSALPHGYDYFPGFHFFVGAVSLFGDLVPYDAIVLTGIAVLAVLVPVAYLLVTRVFGDSRLGLAAAVGVTVFEYVAYHALYFFPQALAFVLVVVAGYAMVSLPGAATTRRFRRYVTYSVGMVFVLVSIHHLTYVLLLVPLAGVAVVSRVGASVAGRLDVPQLADLADVRVRLRWAFPAVFGAAVLVAYLVYSPSLILFGIAGFAYALTTGLVAVGDGGSAFFYGAAPIADSVARGLTWLRTPTGIYYSVLGGVLLAGLYECLSSLDRYARYAGLLVVSFGAVPLFFPLPVEVPQLERLVFTLTAFVVFPLGIGIARTLRTSQRHRRYAVVGLVLVATLGTTGAFTQLTADDIGAVYLEERDTQSAMTDAEYAAVVDTAAFLETHGRAPATSDYVTRRSVESATFPSPMNDGLRTEADGLSAPPGYLVVRSSWADHTVPVITGDGLLETRETWFSVSRDRLDSELADRNVVHATDETYVLYDDDGYEGVFGERGVQS